MCIVCYGLFALPVGVNDRLCFKIVALPRHLQILSKSSKVVWQNK